MQEILRRLPESMAVFGALETDIRSLGDWFSEPLRLRYGKRMFFEPPVKHKVVATAAASNA